MNLYFAYGAHLSYFRLLQHAPTATVLSVACLPGYQISFSKRGADGLGACTIQEQSQSPDTVFGVVYLLGIDEKEMLDQVTGQNAGYDTIPVSVLTPGGPLEAFTYIAQKDQVDPALMPSRSCVERVIEGANDHRLPGYYVDTLRGFHALVPVDTAPEDALVSVPAA